MERLDSKRFYTVVCERTRFSKEYTNMEMVETEYSVYVVLENGDEDGDGSDATYNEAQSHAKRTAQASNLPTVVYEEKWLGDRRVSFNPIYRHAKPYQR